MIISKMNFYNFLLNEEIDFKGRFLSDIWAFNDNEIENCHDFIQMIFPLNKPSKAVFHNYYLNDKYEVDQIRKNQKINTNLIKSKAWFLGFLKRNNKWKKYSDHNQLRITRIIECMRLLVSNNEADHFYSTIISMLGSNSNINKKTLEFWLKA